MDNAEEKITIVDTLGNKTLNVLSRKEIHTEGHCHETVHLFIINSRFDILLQQRSKNKSMYPLCWGSSVAGHIDSTSTPLATITREAYEELSISLNPEELTYIGKVYEEARSGTYLDREFINVFVMKSDQHLDLIKTNQEVEKVEYFKFDKVLELSSKKDPSLLPLYKLWFLILGHIVAIK